MEENIYAKLVKVQNELKAPKNQRNSFGGYNYRSAEDILEAVKPLLEKYQLAQFISDEIIIVNERYYVKTTVCLINVTSPSEQIIVSAEAREEEVKKGMDGSQITGASSSYARKYALNGLYAIDDNKDSDFTNKHEDTNVLDEDLKQQLVELGKNPDQIVSWAKSKNRDINAVAKGVIQKALKEKGEI